MLTQTNVSRLEPRVEARVEAIREPQPRRPSVPALLRGSRVAGTFTVDANARIDDCNAAFAEMLGYSSPRALLGLSLTDNLSMDTFYWRRCLGQGGEILDLCQPLRRADGDTVVVRGDARVRRDTDGRVTGLEALVVKVPKPCPADAVQADRLAEGPSALHALGALTSGVAHDFNNLLTVIVGNLYLLVEGVRDDDKLLKKVKSARDAAKRGADLTRQLLTFARQESGEPAKVDVAAAIGKVQGLLERTLGPDVALESRVSEELWPIRVDVAQFESAIINLAVNARDAMRHGGRLSIGAAGVSLDAARLAGDLDPGDYVVVSVADDGPGIPEAIRKQVFEPFFSTKADRGGSGLGLSMVRQFAERAGGRVELVSEVGHGTTVKLILPRAPLDSTEALTLGATRPLFTLPAGEETVLVLSADGQVRATVRELLEALGYSVTPVSDVSAALSTLHRDPIDLLLSDAVPGPGMTARELLAAVKDAAPAVESILMGDGSPSGGGTMPPAAVLPKPFSLDELATTVRRVLDARS